MPEGGHEDDQAGLFESSQNTLRIGTIEFRLDPHEDIALARLLEHLHRVGAGRQCPGDIPSHRICRFPENANLGSRDRRQLVGKALDQGCRRGLHRGIAEEHGRFFAFDEILCDCSGHIAGLDALQPRGSSNALQFGGRLDHGTERRR
jgi:hypothetical protein